MIFMIFCFLMHWTKINLSMKKGWELPICTQGERRMMCYVMTLLSLSGWPPWMRILSSDGTTGIPAWLFPARFPARFRSGSSIKRSSSLPVMEELLELLAERVREKSQLITLKLHDISITIMNILKEGIFDERESMCSSTFSKILYVTWCECIKR